MTEVHSGLAKPAGMENDTTQTPPYFFTTSTTKLVLMSICTLLVYQLYWFYQNWRLIKNRSRPDIMPFWRAVFSPLWAYKCFEEIRDTANEHGVEPLRAAFGLGVFYFGLSALSKLPAPYWIVCFLNVVPLIPANRAAARLNQHIAPDSWENSRFSLWNWAALVLGGLIVAASVLGAFLPPQ